jgi:hypothetical protein
MSFLLIRTHPYTVKKARGNLEGSGYEVICKERLPQIWLNIGIYKKIILFFISNF